MKIHPPDLLIKELKQKFIEALNPEDVRPEREKLCPVLELSLKYLDTSTQECALYPSHFPGSFSHEAAMYTHINKPAECLSSLADSSQYSYADQHRYKFHKLIREYMLGVESQHQFVSYYTNCVIIHCKRKEWL